MRIFLILPIVALLLASCGKDDEVMTVEEQIMTKAFAGFVAAGTWDSVCGGKKLAAVTDPKKNPDFVTYMGNRQLFGSRMGVLWRVRHPKGTLEEGLTSLINTDRTISTKIVTALKEKGCDSEDGIEAKKMFLLYTKTHPSRINETLDKAIVKQGGKVTQPAAIKK